MENHVFRILVFYEIELPLGSASHLLMEKASMFQCFFALFFHILFFELSCFTKVRFRHDFLIAMEARTDLAEGGRMHQKTNGCVMLPIGPYISQSTSRDECPKPQHPDGSNYTNSRIRYRLQQATGACPTSQERC